MWSRRRRQIASFSWLFLLSAVLLGGRTGVAAGSRVGGTWFGRPLYDGGREVAAHVPLTVQAGAAERLAHVHTDASLALTLSPRTITRRRS